MRRLWVPVAIPPAVRPLRPEQHCDEVSHPAVAMLTEPAANGEGVALHRGVAPFSAVQHEGLVRRRDPVQYVVCCPVRLEAGARHTELDQRDKAPVRPLPFRVRVHAEPAVGLLPGQQPRDLRPAPLVV